MSYLVEDTTVLLNFMQCCPHNQTLHFGFICSVAPKQLSPLAYTLSVPVCGVQHKILNYEITDSKVIIVPQLLQLPAIRLQEFAFSFEKESQATTETNCNIPCYSCLTIVMSVDTQSIFSIFEVVHGDTV